MLLLAKALTILVGVLHLGFAYLEMVLWDTPKGRKIFKKTEEEARSSKVLAANQGIYNAALGACLIWAAVVMNFPAAIALLIFVIVAGIYGAATASKTIFFVQPLPAIIALGVTYFSSSPVAG